MNDEWINGECDMVNGDSQFAICNLQFVISLPDGKTHGNIGFGRIRPY